MSGLCTEYATTMPAIRRPGDGAARAGSPRHPRRPRRPRQRESPSTLLVARPRYLWGELGPRAPAHSMCWRANGGALEPISKHPQPQEHQRYLHCWKQHSSPTATCGRREDLRQLFEIARLCGPSALTGETRRRPCRPLVLEHFGNVFRQRPPPRTPVRNAGG